MTASLLCFATENLQPTQNLQQPVQSEYNFLTIPERACEAGQDHLPNASADKIACSPEEGVREEFCEGVGHGSFLFLCDVAPCMCKSEQIAVQRTCHQVRQYCFRNAPELSLQRRVADWTVRQILPSSNCASFLRTGRRPTAKAAEQSASSMNATMHLRPTLGCCGRLLIWY